MLHMSNDQLAIFHLVITNLLLQYISYLVQCCFVDCEHVPVKLLDVDSLLPKQQLPLSM